MESGSAPEEPNVHPLGRRERKKLETRDALERAALQLFVDRGFGQTTVEDITEAADVSPRTFFRYFESKESVLFSNSEDLLRGLEEALAQCPPGDDTLDSIRAAFKQLAQQQTDDRDVMLIRARVSLDAPEVQARAAQVGGEWEALLMKWLVERFAGRSDAEMRAAVIAGACVSALRVGVGMWVMGGGIGDPDTFVDNALDILQNGLDL